MQETGDPPLAGVVARSEWPYEGVYRVQRLIPLGYRVGGTAICALALLAAPGYADDPKRQDAVGRACAFVCAAVDHPLMSPEYEGGYDVRGWGHCYGLELLLRLKSSDAVPEGMQEEVARRTLQYLAALQQIEIPEVGGWSYSRRPQRAPSPASPFMTGPVLQALFEAKRQGLPVDDAVVQRGVAALERCRLPSGAIGSHTLPPHAHRSHHPSRGRRDALWGRQAWPGSRRARRAAAHR